MKYTETIKLKDGRICILRSCTSEDSKEVAYAFSLAHEETDFLLTYPDENNFSLEDEARYLDGKLNSDNELELLAEVNGKVVGVAGLDSLGKKYKIRHRVDFGISIIKEYWNLGIGGALTKACIKCAKRAGYEQIELTVVSNNTSAISLYKKLGFVEFGRNPKGFKSRYTGYQEVIHMRLEL